MSNFRRLIEWGDWDERLLAREKWLNGFCWGSMAVFVLCLLPSLVRLFP